MKQNINTIAFALCALFIFFGVYGIAYQKGVTKRMREELKANEQALNDKLDAKDADIEKLLEAVRNRDVQLAELDNSINELSADRERWKEDAIYWKDRAETAPPETLVADIREILGTDEIWQTEDGILFSLNAFRQVSMRLYDWKDFTEVREPNYIESLELYKTKIYVLTVDIADLKEAMIAMGEKFDLQQAFTLELRDYIKKDTGKDFWGTVKQVGTGIAIGVATAYIIRDFVIKK